MNIKYVIFTKSEKLENAILKYFASTLFSIKYKLPSYKLYIIASYVNFKILNKLRSFIKNQIPNY